ncbi:uncharacterized protein LOC116265383 [Nymphaea colorata]|nr:uncharacterized protein LOC116265383 [Nymphaea colorata]
MAASSASVALLGGSRLQDFNVGLTTVDQNLFSPSRFAFRRRENQLGHLKLNTRLAVRAGLNEDTRGGGGGEFLAGFLLGGAVFGTLAYVFASQIRRSLQYEDEYGFSRARRPVYYDEGLEKTRQTLNAKISQLNSAIDNVSSLLRGGKNENSEPVEADPEVEATI